VKRKPKPLGTEFKCIADSKTGVMIALDICEGKEAMSKKELSKELGNSASTTLRLIEEGKHHANYDSEHSDEQRKSIFMADSWFGSVKVAAEVQKRGQHCCMNVKTNTKHSPKRWIDNKMKDFPGGTWITLKGEYQDEELYFIGYKYNKRKILSFVFTSGAGTVEPGVPYEAKFPDKFGNLHVRKIGRPAIIGRFFQCSNCVDCHNQSRQHDLALEECWVTTDAYFRLSTTIIGFTVTDAWKLTKYHSKRWAKERVVAFSNRLAFSLLHNLKPAISPMDIIEVPLSVESYESSVTKSDSEIMHTKERLPVIKTKPADCVSTRSGRSAGSKSYTKQIRCVWCSRVHGVIRKTSLKCAKCGVGFCSERTGRNCWLMHIQNHGPPPAKRLKENSRGIIELL